MTLSRFHDLFRRSLGATLLLLVALVAVGAPRASAETTLPPFELAPASVPTAEIPLYFVVMHFFDTTAHYRAEMPHMYETRLFELDLEPGSAREEALVAALAAAGPILERSTVDESLIDSDDEFVAFQERAIAAKARDLAAVYGRFLSDLDATGLAPGEFQEALDRVFRPKVHLFVDVVPGQDPVDALLAEPSVQRVLSFEDHARGSAQPANR